MAKTDRPAELFGAWERDNIGDLASLFPSSKMNGFEKDKELSDLLDFSAMFTQPNGSKLSSSATENGLHSPLQSSSRTANLEDGGRTWQSSPTLTTVGGFEQRGFGSENPLDPLEDDSDYIARKSSYPFTNSASIGSAGFGDSSNGPPGLPPPLQSQQDVSLGTSPSDWRRKKYKNSSKNEGSLLSTVYSPGADDMMAQGPGEASQYPTKHPLYSDIYYGGADHGSPDPWSHPNSIGPTSTTYNPTSGLAPTYGLYSHHGPHHEPITYMGREAYERMATLPPMSSFHQDQRFHHASPVPSPLTSTDPSVLAQVSRSGSGSQAIGKALASIYSDSPTNYSSNPPTPIASPPPLTSINDRPLSAGSSSSAPGTWPRPNLQAMPSPPGPYESHLHSLSRMEERLDDAIYVLRNHAEGQFPREFHGPMGAPVGVPGYPAGSVPSSLSGNTSSAADTVSNSADDRRGISSSGGNRNSRLSDSGGSKSSKKQASGSTSNAEVTTLTTADGEPGGGSEGSGDEDLGLDEDIEEGHTGGKQVRETERRYANNARERLRVRDINEAFKELGRMCQMHLQSDKPQTKLVVLHQAVSVITSLESQVRERNLNPKAACLKRREEEKVDDELPEKRLAPSDLDKPYDHVGLSPGGGPMRGGGNRARRGRRSSRGGCGDV
ncbi:transcription factor 12-like isoform X2 [Dendronephthya gigantea]|uniref:transcription factor 12-like isoform X2 n=1 Tax=Dendronephthya gigantea TaxID=151771 RepID=UPI00106CF9DB|nr:transcription factor 12-like isoform X2 [Dendronephthya gigantea]